MSSGGFRNEPLSTEAETTIEVLALGNPQTPPLLIQNIVPSIFFLQSS